MDQILFGAGETIFHEGDISDQTYRILAGSVDILVLGKDGGEKRIASLGPGEIFGEMGIISPAPRSATAIARESTACQVIPADQVIELMSSDPEQVIDLLRSLILRLRNTNRKLAAKSSTPPPKRSDAL
ncbi:MAG: cyclic nucleotide-binding domain-containing protein [Pseudomonadota bacterium]